MGTMARPAGQFNQEKDRLLKELQGLANFGCCFATSKYLAARMRKSEQQVERYINALRKEGKLEVKTTSGLRDPATGGFYRKRYIRITGHGAKPKKVSKYMRPTEPPALPPMFKAMNELNSILEANAAAEAEDREILKSLEETYRPAYDEDELARELKAELAALGIDYKGT